MQGPIREATEAEIAARRALIAAAKAGASLQLSPRDLPASVAAASPTTGPAEAANPPAAPMSPTAQVCTIPLH